LKASNALFALGAFWYTPDIAQRLTTDAPILKTDLKYPWNILTQDKNLFIIEIRFFFFPPERDGCK
jgi:hypothetical protein